MKNEFSNRLGMFQTSMGILQNPDRKSIWFQKDPKAFTLKVADAAAAVSDLEKFCKQQQTRIIGAAGDKRVGKDTLSFTAHSLGGALATWFEDQKDLTDASKVNFPLSKWEHMTGEELKGNAKVVYDLANTVATGTSATAAADYDITPDSVQELDDDIQNFDELVTSPQQEISKRKSLTDQLRAKFNDVESKFVQLDRLILRFAGTEDGQALIAAYQAARIIRDYGIGHDPDAPTPPPAPQGSK